MATYRGVCPDKGKFRVQITQRLVATGERKYYHLGYYDDEREAALVYDVAAEALQGDEAVLNFPGVRPPIELFDKTLRLLLKKGLVELGDDRVWDYWRHKS